MKKLLTILFLIMLIISFFQITSMYALYKEQIQGEYNTLLGAWKIKVNGDNITSTGQVATFTIDNQDQLGYVTSDYIQAGKIAPGGQSYFDIVIDPSETDVSIKYTLEIDTKATSSTNTGIELSDAIELVKCDNYFGQGEDGNTGKTENDRFYQSDNKYTSIIPVDKINDGYKNYVRIYFKWKNVTETVEIDEVETKIEKNNESDTILGQTENAKISIPLKINLKQYTGEVISNGS